MSKVRREEGLGRKNLEGYQHLRKKETLQKESGEVTREVRGKPEERGIMEVGDLEVAEAFIPVKRYQGSIKIRTEEFPLEVVTKEFLITLSIAVLVSIGLEARMKSVEW